MLQSKHFRYCAASLALLVLLALWLWQQNSPRAIESALDAGARLQCASYAPYYGPGQSPFVAGTRIERVQIEQDLQRLSARFDCVRTYSVGQGLDHVPEAAARLGLKVLLGIWIGGNEIDNERELALGLRLANRHAGVVRGLIVGNEVLLRHDRTPQQLRAYLQRARRATSVPVSYADVWEFWLKHRALADAVDYVTVHILPYWEDDPQPVEQAIAHADAVMDKLHAAFDKPLLIGETGWPSLGRQRNGSAPGRVNQARYIRDFVRHAHERHWNYNIIEAIDQPWKRVLEGTVGAYWGMYDRDLRPKFALQGPVAERQDGWRPPAWALGGLLLFALLAWPRPHGARRLALLAPTALLSGLMAGLQLEYLAAACRNPWEWLTLGGVAAIGWFALLLLPALLFDDKAGRRARCCLWLLLAAATAASCLLLLDGRYRDFPISLYALPALQFGLLLPLAGVHGASSRRFRLLAVIGAIVAAALAAREPANQSAWIWLGLTLLFVMAGFARPTPSVVQENDKS